MKTLLALLAVGVCAGCNGTETDNPVGTDDGPLVHFESSPCKRESEPVPGQQPLVQSSDADGLQCFGWEHDDEALSLRLLNFDAGCVAGWDGQARVAADGAIELVLTVPGCQIASCGSCLYDFDFELGGVSSAAELAVRVGFVNCSTSETDWTHEVSLPLEGAASGSLCRPVPSGALSWQAITTDRCGTYHMPCGDECDGTSGCDEGLSCTALDGDADHRCLETCSTNADCSSPLTTCQDQLCRPEATF